MVLSVLPACTLRMSCESAGGDVCNRRAVPSPHRRALPRHRHLLCAAQPTSSLSHPRRFSLLHPAARLPPFPFCHWLCEALLCACREYPLQIQVLIFFWSFWRTESGGAFCWWSPKSCIAGHISAVTKQVDAYTENSKEHADCSSWENIRHWRIKDELLHDCNFLKFISSMILLNYSLNRHIKIFILKSSFLKKNKTTTLVCHTRI